MAVFLEGCKGEKPATTTGTETADKPVDRIVSLLNDPKVDGCDKSKWKVTAKGDGFVYEDKSQTPPFTADIQKKKVKDAKSGKEVEKWHFTADLKGDGQLELQQCTCCKTMVMCVKSVPGKKNKDAIKNAMAKLAPNADAKKWEAEITNEKITGLVEKKEKKGGCCHKDHASKDLDQPAAKNKKG